MSAEALEDQLLRKTLTERFEGLSRQELLGYAEQFQQMRARLALEGPQTDDELHAWIKNQLGIDIPRVAVCEDHQAPFDFIAAVYFGRVSNAVAIANRGGSKTMGAAILHYMRCRFWAGVETASVGAVEMQARRAYAHVEKLLDKKVSEGLVDPNKRTQQRTSWKNGSQTEILGGTVNAVNGPHPQLVHLDEVELMDPEVLAESANMPASGVTTGGVPIPAQYVITSTRKRAHGQMARIVKSIEDARNRGFDPPYELFHWCLFETAQQVPNCRVANPDCDTPCDCRNVVNGFWDAAPGEQPEVRTLESVCKGKLFRSRGYIPYGDIVRDFKTIPRAVWEAQNECLRPSTEGLVLPEMKRETYGIRLWDPDPELGPIFLCWDPGGTHAHAVLWFQLLRYEADAVRLNGKSVRLPAGSRVVFDEIYLTDIGNSKLADRVVRREAAWRDKHPTFRVVVRTADPAARGARLDWLEHDPPLPTVFYGRKDVKAEIDHLRDDIVDNGLLWVDVERCPMTWEEIEMWHYPTSRAGMIDDPELPVEDFDHAMACLRYQMKTLKHLLRRRDTGRSEPVADDTTHATVAIRKMNEAAHADGPAASNGRDRMGSEAWRGSLGAPMTHRSF